MRLTKKVAIVTGGARGIGEAIVRAFIKEGAYVLIGDVIQDRTETLVKEIRSSHQNAQIDSVFCNITSVKKVTSMIECCIKIFGEPNVLINNAGKNFFNDPLKTNEKEWDNCLSTDLTGAWNCSKAVLPYMIKNQDGAIVNIASVHGHKIIPGCFPYPIAKHGLLGLTKALGVEYGKYNIRVNSISPGLIETPLTMKWYKQSVAQGIATDIQSFRKMQSDKLPSKRIGTPTEVAMLTVLLASDEARFINATDILIDGGRSALYHY